MRQGLKIDFYDSLGIDKQCVSIYVLRFTFYAENICSEKEGCKGYYYA